MKEPDRFTCDICGDSCTKGNTILAYDYFGFTLIKGTHETDLCKDCSETMSSALEECFTKKPSGDYLKSIKKIQYLY